MISERGVGGGGNMIFNVIYITLNHGVIHVYDILDFLIINFLY